MKYFDFVIILIPTLLAVITFVFYLPLCIKSFDIEQSVTYKNVSKNKFKILVFLICISIGLSFSLLIHKKNLFYYISSWIGQFFIVYVYFKKLVINYNVLKKFIRGENLEFEIHKSNNDLSIEGYYSSTKIKEDLSEDIRVSTSKVLNVTKESKEIVIDSINFNSIEIKESLTEAISNSSINSKSDFSIKYVDVFRDIDKYIFEQHFKNNKLIKTEEDKLIFYNLVCNSSEPTRKINLDIRIRDDKNIPYYKKEIALFLNLFIRVKEIIEDNDKKNEELADFLSEIFTINGKDVKFHPNDFTRNL